MGDTGSSSLGLLAAAFSLWGARENVFPFWAALITFSPFIVDATITLLCRMLRGEKFWQPHKTHHYQRLVGLGWSHRKTALWGYALMAACAVSAACGRSASPAIQWAIIGVWIAAYALIAVTVRRLEARAGA